MSRNEEGLQECGKAKGNDGKFCTEYKEMSIIPDLKGLTFSLGSMTHKQSDNNARSHIIKYQINNSRTRAADLKKG